ncbi:hypothetical protein PR048_033651 [Dryococelus australis]|uniref:Uncharacterized protein n=1 Tax=Dryococelus australis TaxID=614101 RepID=A0ABQ9G3W9_9NEOP|nr:hypothetical protein PR048_033651 [Dryococelus australis]
MFRTCPGIRVCLCRPEIFADPVILRSLAHSHLFRRENFKCMLNKIIEISVDRRVFSRISRFPALSSQRPSIFTPITLIGSQDLACVAYTIDVMWPHSQKSGDVMSGEYGGHAMSPPLPIGATVAEQLACSPPTKAIWVQSSVGLLQIFSCGNHAGRCRWSVIFLGDLPFPPPFHPGSAPRSPRFTLIGS